MAAKLTHEGQGLAGEGWNIKPDIISAMYTDFSEALFEAIVDLADVRVAGFDSNLSAWFTPGS